MIWVIQVPENVYIRQTDLSEHGMASKLLNFIMQQNVTFNENVIFQINKYNCPWPFLLKDSVDTHLCNKIRVTLRKLAPPKYFFLWTQDICLGISPFSLWDKPLCSQKFPAVMKLYFMIKDMWDTSNVFI